MTLSNAMNLSLFIATPGSNGVPVLVQQDMALNIRASISETEIRSAVACLPSQTIEYSERLDISESNGTQIQSGHITSGTMQISLQNYIAVGSRLDVVVNGMTKNGEPLRTSTFVDARSSQNISVDVADYTFEQINMSYLPFSIVVRTADSKDVFVTITSSDSISATISLTDIIFDQVTGTIAPTLITVEHSQPVDLRFSQKFDGTIKCSDVKMWVDIRNNSALPLEVESGRLTCYNQATHQSAKVDVPLTTIGANGSTEIHFDKGQVSAMFESFGSSLPDRIDIEALATLNKNRAFGTLSSEDFLSGTLHVEIPMRLDIESAIYKDVAEIKLDDETIKNLQEVDTGELHVEIENHLPTGFMLELHFLDATLTTILLTPKSSTGDPFHVSAGTLDGQGSVTEATKTAFVIPLSKEDIGLFLSSKYISYSVIIDKSETSPILFRMDDYVNIKTYATFSASTKLITSK